MEKAKKLRECFDKYEILRIMGAHNALGAKLIEKNGFDGVWASGLEISASHGLPDASILTMTDFLTAAQSINYATDLPVIADCDTGYGNALNVMNMVLRYESAGIAAVCIEDKKFPKVNSFIEGRQELAPADEFVDKIRAAKDTQKTEDFMVFARVEALIAGLGLEEALDRANLYADAGADGIFIHSKSKTPCEIFEFIKRWDRATPLILCPTTYSCIRYNERGLKGKVQMVIYANYGVRAQIRAMDAVFSKIYAEGTAHSVEAEIATMEDVFDIQDMSKLKEAEKLYLRKSDGLSRITGDRTFDVLLDSEPVRSVR